MENTHSTGQPRTATRHSTTGGRTRTATSSADQQHLDGEHGTGGEHHQDHDNEQAGPEAGTPGTQQNARTAPRRRPSPRRGTWATDPAQQAIPTPT
ncbi:hypothetical protein ACIOGZ_29225 [Kitasatospora sp. NPDC088160]|uniref:hypothetical protein n=1 Tax=Kitasatospora sp. NPDC088160 TaxID=3364072 RepID=UPI003805AF97